MEYFQKLHDGFNLNNGCMHLIIIVSVKTSCNFLHCNVHRKSYTHPACRKPQLVSPHKKPLGLCCLLAFFSIWVHVHYVHWIHEIAEASSSMYPSYSLNLDLVREATGVHWEEFLVVTCRLGTPSLMLKYTFAFRGMQISSSISESLSELWFGSVSGDDQEETCVKRRMVVEVSFYACWWQESNQLCSQCLGSTPQGHHLSIQAESQRKLSSQHQC